MPTPPPDSVNSGEYGGDLVVAEGDVEAAVGDVEGDGVAVADGGRWGRRLRLRERRG